ncbi:MAG TPA: hypothetical protein VLA04_02465 [Verrucomicrobiae bacterium]|nr:hypothetical protein [Verrucomicrobiae bacterium]
MLKRPAFTLLETVIALALAVVVMGAAVSANRAVQRNAAVTEMRTQQEALVQDAVDMITLTHNALRSATPAQPLSDAFLPVTLTASPVRIAPYRTRPGSQASITTTHPIHLLWCASGNPGCAGLVSPAGPTNASYTMSSALNVSEGEVIAVRKGVPSALQNFIVEPQVYDFTYLPTTGTNTTTYFASDLNHQKDWDFYRRTISIATSTSYTGYSLTVAVWPILGGVDRKGEAVSQTLVLTNHVPGTGLAVPPPGGGGGGGGGVCPTLPVPCSVDPNTVEPAP